MSSAAASPGMWSGGHGAAPPPEAHTPYLVSVGLLGADTMLGADATAPPSLHALQPSAAQQETLEAHPQHGAERSAPQSPLPGPTALAQQLGQQQVEAVRPAPLSALSPAPLSTLSTGISALSPGSSAQELIHSHELARAYATQA